MLSYTGQRLLCSEYLVFSLRIIGIYKIQSASYTQCKHYYDYPAMMYIINTATQAKYGREYN